MAHFLVNSAVKAHRERPTSGKGGSKAAPPPRRSSADSQGSSQPGATTAVPCWPPATVLEALSVDGKALSAPEDDNLWNIIASTGCVLAGWQCLSVSQSISQAVTQSLTQSVSQSASAG